MSGLEPIAALGLACNILQVIGIGRETVRLAKQVYQNGTVDPALTESAVILDDLSSRIRSAPSVASKAQLTTRAQDKQLFDLAEKCQLASRALCEEVNFLEGLATKGKLSGLAKTVLKTMWRKRRLEKLDQQLGKAESLLQTGLLTEIYGQSKNTLLSLDADLKSFIVEYRKGHADASDLMRKHITAETERNQEAIKIHVTQNANKVDESLSNIGVAMRAVSMHQQDAQSQAKRDRLVRSLKFDRMNERRNLVAPSHHNTFTWMLRDGSDVEGSQRSSDRSECECDPGSESCSDDSGSEHASNSWDSFSDWLRSTGLVYWISGKPGSGKTTLMKHLLSHPQTQTYLDEWSHGAIIISHFFWRPGTIMQQSIKGLMSSLLHQLLLGEPEVVDHVLGSAEDMPMKENETDWSTEELQKTILSVISRYPRPIAIFLDGLDEVFPKDGVLRLLNIVDQLRQPCGHAGKTKICLGSRRETLLYKRLCGYPQLRLEQLNEVDLWHYGQDNVMIPSDYRVTISTNHRKYYHPAFHFCRETPPSRDQFREWLVSTLVDKAEGVFLWLCLTVTTVTKALNEGETFEDLEARIRSLPSDLADLYTDMWNRMNDDGNDLRVRAATYFQLVLARTYTSIPRNLFIMMVATNPEKAEIILQRDPSQRTSAASLIEACKETRRDATTRCAGLLVCPSPSEVRTETRHRLYPWHGEQYDELLPYVSELPEYSFLHRTAQDFLTDTEAGQCILSFGRFPGNLARLKLIEAHLALCQLYWEATYRAYKQTVKDQDSIVAYPVDMIRDVFENLCEFSEMEEDASTRRENFRLFLLCERLFNNGQLINNGQLLGNPMVPFETIQFEQDPRHPEYSFYYNTTVERQHEFLIVSAKYGITGVPGLWRFLLPVIMGRHLNEYTKCRLLIQACTLDPSYNPLRLDSRLDVIQSLLDRGALPYHQIASQVAGAQVWSPSLIATTETAFKVLMTTVWLAATREAMDNNVRRKLLELIALFITKGADPHEEIHISIEVEGRSINFVNPWFRPSLAHADNEPPNPPNEFGHIIIVLAYPASALLAHVLHIWKLGDHSRVGWVPEECRVPDHGIGNGRPISIVEMEKVLKLKDRVYSTPPLLRSAAIFNLRDEDGTEKYFLGLIRLVEESLQGAAVTTQREQWSGHIGDCLSHISVPLEIQEDMAAGLQRLRDTDVPVRERRKELRTRLGVTTPLEEPEWQEDCVTLN